MCGRSEHHALGACEDETSTTSTTSTGSGAEGGSGGTASGGTGGTASCVKGYGMRRVYTGPSLVQHEPLKAGARTYNSVELAFRQTRRTFLDHMADVRSSLIGTTLKRVSANVDPDREHAPAKSLVGARQARTRTPRLLDGAGGRDRSLSWLVWPGSRLARVGRCMSSAKLGPKWGLS